MNAILSTLVPLVLLVLEVGMRYPKFYRLNQGRRIVADEAFSLLFKHPQIMIVGLDTPSVCLSMAFTASRRTLKRQAR